MVVRWRLLRRGIVCVEAESSDGSLGPPVRERDRRRDEVDVRFTAVVDAEDGSSITTTSSSAILVT